ncbi:MAG: metallophosphoesterase [Flammeovirgaceae bacterium]
MNKLIVIPILALILVSIDLYVFQAIKTITQDWSVSNKKIAHSLYWGFTAILMVGLFTYHFVDPERVGRSARTFIMVGIFMIYLSKIIAFLFVFIDDIIRFFTWVANKLSGSQPEGMTNGVTRSEFLAKAGLALASVPFLGMSYGIIFGAHDYRIRRKKVYLPNLPESFNGLRIAQISDIHAGSFFNKRAVARGVKMIMEQAADLIFFTGDLVNNRASEVENYKSLFSRLSAPLGVFSVLGNHDYGDYIRWESDEAKAKNLADLKKAHGEMGWRLLLNEHELIEKNGEQLAIIGVENWGAGGFVKHGDLDKAYKGAEKAPVKLLLSHDPSHWTHHVQKTDIDITFSGHTHGMQFGIEVAGIKWSPVKYRYKQWAGLYKEANQYLYVNRGFGYLGFPGRVGMPPEITILELHKGDA